jgi:hypothetical protein
VRRVDLSDSENIEPVSEVSSKKSRQLVKSSLKKWEDDGDIAGAYIVTLIDQESLEVEVRKTGKVPGFSPDEFRTSLLTAAETTKCAWNCEPEGLGYPIRSSGVLLGLCIVFPSGDIHPLSKWEKDVAGLALQMGTLLSPEGEDPPSLNSLADAIPERDDLAEEEPKKLHWETSKTRVQVPVQEELACHLILDHMPLF